MRIPRFLVGLISRFRPMRKKAMSSDIVTRKPWVDNKHRAFDPDNSLASLVPSGCGSISAQRDSRVGRPPNSTPQSYPAFTFALND